MKNNEDVYYDFYFYFPQELVQHVPTHVFWNFARTSYDSQGCT